MKTIVNVKRVEQLQ